MSIENIAYTSAEIVANIKKLYYSSLIAEENLKLWQHTLERANQRFKDVKLLFEQGIASNIDTMSLYIEIENLKPLMLKANNAIYSAKLNLCYLMGLPTDRNISLKDSLNLQEDNLNTEINLLVEEAFNNRPELKLLKLKLKTAEAIKEYENSANLPVVNIFGRFRIEAQEDNFSIFNYRWPNSYFAGVQVSYPIFSGNKIDSRIQQAEIEKKKATIELEDTRNLISTEIKINISNLEESNQTIILQRKTIELATANYERVKNRYKNGLLKLSDLRDAELTLRQAESAIIQSTYNYLLVKTELEKSLGRNGKD
jgi:outer membrane protein TolC